MADEKTIVDNSSMDMGYEPYEPPKQKRSPMGVFKNALERITNPFNNQYGEDEREVDLKEAMSPKQYADYMEEQKRAWGQDSKENESLDVPEIETEVVDLPKEDENEKELVVEHTDENEPTGEETIDTSFMDMGYEPPEDVTVGQTSVEQNVEEPVTSDTTNTQPKETPVPSEDKDKTLTTEELKSQTDYEKDRRVRGQMLDKANKDEKLEKIKNDFRALAQNDLEGFNFPEDGDKWTPQQKQAAIDRFFENQKSTETTSEEPAKVMTDEEALEEARMLAQDDLEGFNISGEDWSKLTTKEKGEVIDRFLNKNKSNDEITNIDEDTTNNYEGYKRYPTGLKVAEDIQGGIHSIADRAERAAKENLAGGTSINNMVSKNAIPHYDYRRFFGQ